MLQILAILKTACPNARIDGEKTFLLWFSKFGREEFSIAKLATDIIISTDSDFFPSISKFGKALERAKLIANNSDQKLIEAKSEEQKRKEQELLDWVVEEFFPEE